MPDQATPDKREKELSDEQKRVFRSARVITEMMNTPGWVLYQKALELHLQMKRNEYEAPAETGFDGIAQVLRSESAKGAIMGIRLALDLPQGIINQGKILSRELGVTPTAGED